MKIRRCCFLGLLGAGLWISGCNHPKPLPSDYFGGEFAYYDDTARFRDCATGRTYIIEQGGDYAEMIRGYEQMLPAPHESVHMFCHAVLKQGADSLLDLPRMTVRSPFGFDRAGYCDPDKLIAGMYRSGSGTGTGNQTLLLKGNYTYSVTRFTETGEERETGRWGLSSESELVLNPGNTNRPQRRFQILPETLVANDGLGQLAFEKVYLD